ncbi:MAG: hypothetical protein ACLFVU_00615 [Phycisphaerae bacterium]
MPRTNNVDTLARLIEDGKSPAEILNELNLAPSRFRPMLTSNRLKQRLQLEEELATLLVKHRLATGIYEAANKLHQLLDGPSSETTRKVCLTFLAAGLNNSQEKTGKRATFRKGKGGNHR